MINAMVSLLKKQRPEILNQTLDKFFSTNDNIYEFHDATASGNIHSPTPRFRSRRWEIDLRIVEWNSGYKSIANLLNYLKVRKSSSEETKSTYCTCIHLFCRKLGIDPDVLIGIGANEIERMVDALIRELRDKGRSLLYIRKIVNVIKTFLVVNGFEKDKLKFSAPRLPARYRARPEYVPTPGEALRMAEVARNLRDKLMILLMAFSGLRVSTMLALRYRDVKDELEKGVENICIEVYPEMKEVIPAACKGNIRYYTFTIKEATEILRLYLEERKRILGGIMEDEPLFITNYNQIEKDERRKRCVSRKQVELIVKECAKAAGLKRWREVTPHSLRKTFQSFLRNQPEATRLDIRDQEFLFGHILEGTMDTYYDWGKVDDLREKFSSMFPDPAKAKIGRRRQKIISVGEVDRHIEEGWLVKQVLPDGRIVIEQELWQ